MDDHLLQDSQLPESILVITIDLVSTLCRGGAFLDTSGWSKDTCGHTGFRQVGESGILGQTYILHGPPLWNHTRQTLAVRRASFG